MEVMCRFHRHKQGLSKRPSSLPAIDQKVEILSKFWLKCFLYAYKGYHQIQMAERDEEKTTFFTRGVFCYKRLPFGLKNTGSTYQRLVDKVFNDQIGRNLEVHVDDMVIKSDSEEDMLVDIKETFDKLRAINMKLNPSKCSFDVEEGPLTTTKDDKRNAKSQRKIGGPESISLKGSRQDTSFLENVKELHKGEDSLMDDRGRRSFLKHEKVHRDIANGHSANRRRNLSNVPRSIRRKHKRSVVSRKRKKAGTYVLREPSAARVPRVGKTHTGPHTCRKKAPEGRIAKWAIELGEHEIEFRGRNFFKRQILAETPSAEDRETKVEETKGKGPGLKNAWKLFTDGASSFDGSRAGLMLVSPEGKEYTYALRFEFETTNNEAKYEALLAGLRITTEMKIQLLAIFVDSQLVANQQLYHGACPKRLEQKADALSKLASMTFLKLAKEVLVELGILPSDPQKARKLRIKAPRYKMIDDKLYRKSHLSPWLRYVGPVQAKNISKRYTKAPVECMQDYGRCGVPRRSTRRCEVPRRSNRLLHKMGRSKATDIHNWEAYREIRLEYSKPLPQSITPKQMGKLRSPTGTSSKEYNKDWKRLIKVRLVYGSEAVVPIEISVETKRIQDFDVKQNEKRRRENLDMLKEKREITSIR
ncbi:reverse transcriptase domain-containing protein [Tanacetum coccineum]